jgi:hypothetical protein
MFGSRLTWLAGIWVAVLSVCFAGTTQAATRLYTGSLIIKSFGNTTTTGTAEPYTSGLFVGIPLTGNCNTEPLHLKETLTFNLPVATPTYTVMFTVPLYGGQVPSVDTNGDTLPDIVPGCGATTVDSGDPLIASGAINTTGATNTNRTSLNPRKFTIPEFGLFKKKEAASFEAYGVYLWEVHFASIFNAGAGGTDTGTDEGVFSKNGGDGAFGPINVNAAKQKRSATQKAGKNQFGGTMRLLGKYGDNEGYFYNNATTTVGYFNWLFHYLGHGGQGTDGGGVVTAAFVTSTVNSNHTRASGYATLSTVYQSLFKWTTGTVTVTAKGGTFPTVIQRKGYDNRTAMGSGAIQLVTPMLTKWVGAGTSATAAIGIMKLNFAPEPSEWLMLASGISMLGLLAHWRRSRRP